MNPKVSLSTTAHLFNYRAAAEMAVECGYDGIEAVAIKGARRAADLLHAWKLGLGVTIHLPIASWQSKDLDFSRRYIQKPAYGEIESCQLLDCARNHNVPCVAHSSTLSSMSPDNVIKTLEFLRVRIENEQTEGSIEHQLRVFNTMKNLGLGEVFTGLAVDIGHAMIERGVGPSDIGAFISSLIREYESFPIEEIHASRVFTGKGGNLEDHGLWPENGDSAFFLGQIARFAREVKAKTVVFEFYPGHKTALQLNFGRQLDWFETGVKYAAETMKAALVHS